MKKIRSNNHASKSKSKKKTDVVSQRSNIIVEGIRNKNARYYIIYGVSICIV